MGQSDWWMRDRRAHEVEVSEMQGHLPEGKSNRVSRGTGNSMPAATLAYWRAHSFTIVTAITGWHGQSETEEQLD